MDIDHFCHFSLNVKKHNNTIVKSNSKNKYGFKPFKGGNNSSDTKPKHVPTQNIKRNTLYTNGPFSIIISKTTAYIYLLLFVVAITITVTIAFTDYSVVDKDRHLFKASFFINTVCVLDIGFCCVVRTTYIDCGITNT